MPYVYLDHKTLYTSEEFLSVIQLCEEKNKQRNIQLCQILGWIKHEMKTLSWNMHG
jgi:hypothetical protein